jgi:hypothetical protein
MLYWDNIIRLCAIQLCENLITRRQSANNLDDTAKEEDDGIQEVETDVSKDRGMEREYTKIITLPGYPAVNKYMAEKITT